MHPKSLAIAAASGLGLVLILGKDRIEEEITVQSDSFTKFDALFKKYGQQYAVPWHWLKAIAMNESSLGQAASVIRGAENPDDVEGSKSFDGKSWGLMQLTLATARDFEPSTQVRDLNDAEKSIRIAARFVRFLMAQVPKTTPKYDEYVIKSYNQGWGNTRKEMAGLTVGFANEYWLRWVRNHTIIQKRQPEAF